MTVTYPCFEELARVYDPVSSVLKLLCYQPVPRGTNGGVTELGLGAALAAGTFIDSLLGATLQFSRFCDVRNKVVGKPGPTARMITGLNFLDDNAVNLVSILPTTLLTSIACVVHLLNP
ncbi:hypothetical protein GQ457_12G023490 [Hibiscus cannabinus]